MRSIAASRARLPDITRSGAVLLATGAVVFALGCGGDSEGSGATEAEDSAPAQEPAPEPAVRKPATRASFASCLKKAGVAFDPSGAVRRDPERTERPSGYDPRGSSSADARYFGAVSFEKGAFADVWITKSTFRAAQVQAALEQPAASEPELKKWSFGHTRNLLYATHATAKPKFGDSSSEEFDRCLRGIE